MANFIDIQGGNKQNMISDTRDRRPMPGGGFPRPMPPQGGAGGGAGAGGGGISPRLDELGNNVSSAEEELNAINQRLDSADSKLGGGLNGGNGGLGKLLTNFGNLGQYTPPQGGYGARIPLQQILRNSPSRGGETNSGSLARMPAADGGLMELMGGTELMAGAPDITYSGDEGPKAPKEMEEIQMAQIKKIYFELIADGMNPKDAEIKAKEIYSKMSSNVTSSGNESGTMDEGIGSMIQEPRTMAAYGGIMGGDGRRAYVGGSYGGGYGETGGGSGGYQGGGDGKGGKAGGSGTGPGGGGGSGNNNDNNNNNTDYEDQSYELEKAKKAKKLADEKAADIREKKRLADLAEKKKLADIKKQQAQDKKDREAKEAKEAQDKKDKEAAEKKSILDRINDYNKNYKEKQRQRYATPKIDELNSKLGT